MNEELQNSVLAYLRGDRPDDSIDAQCDAVEATLPPEAQEAWRTLRARVEKLEVFFKLVSRAAGSGASVDYADTDGAYDVLEVLETRHLCARCGE